MSRFSVRRICDCEILRRYLAKAASQPVVVDACIRVYVVELRVCRCAPMKINTTDDRPTDRPTDPPTESRADAHDRAFSSSVFRVLPASPTLPSFTANPFCELSSAHTDYYVYTCTDHPPLLQSKAAAAAPREPISWDLRYMCNM